MGQQASSEYDQSSVAGSTRGRYEPSGFVAPAPGYAAPAVTVPVLPAPGAAPAYAAPAYAAPPATMPVLPGAPVQSFGQVRMAAAPQLMVGSAVPTAQVRAQSFSGTAAGARRGAFPQSRSFDGSEQAPTSVSMDFSRTASFDTSGATSKASRAMAMQQALAAQPKQGMPRMGAQPLSAVHGLPLQPLPTGPVLPTVPMLTGPLGMPLPTGSLPFGPLQTGPLLTGPMPGMPGAAVYGTPIGSVPTQTFGENAIPPELLELGPWGHQISNPAAAGQRFGKGKGKGKGTGVDDDTNYRIMPPNLPPYQINPEAIWFDKILCAIWPRAITWGIGLVADAIEDALSKALQAPTPKALKKGFNGLREALKNNPVRLPVTRYWVNSCIDDVWKLVTPVVEELLPGILEKFIKDKLPGPLKNISINPCSLGQHRPKVTNITTTKVERRTTSQDHFESLYLVFDVEFIADDLEILVNGPWHVVKFGCEGFTMNCEVHAILTDLVDHFPFVTGARIFMVNPINFTLDWAGCLDFLDSDVIESEIHSIVNKVVSSIAVLPNSIALVLDSQATVERVFDVMCPRPRGLLRIRVCSAKGLRCDDFNFSSLWSGKRTSDPFCHIRIGADNYDTEVIKGSDGNCEWPMEEDYYFLVYEPEVQTIDVEIFDKDLVSGSDPLARRRGIRILDFLGLQDNDQLLGYHSRHLMMPLEVLWADKAKPGGKAEKTKMDMLAPHPPEEHAGILAKLGGFAQEVYKDVTAATKKVEAEFDKRTGADPEQWKNLESEVEMIAKWKPFALGSEWRPADVVDNQLFTDQEEFVSCLLFVGIVMAHQLPTDKEGARHVYKARLTVNKSVDPKGVAVLADNNVSETSACEKSMVKRVLTGGDLAATLTSDDAQQELRRKIKLLKSKQVSDDDIAGLLDIPVSYITSEGSEPLDFEYGPLWEYGKSFMLDNSPGEVQVKIEVIQVEEIQGIANKLLEKPKETLIGEFGYNIADLLKLDYQKYTDEQFRKPLCGPNANGAKLSTYFQLITFSDEEEGMGKGKGKGKDKGQGNVYHNFFKGQGKGAGGTTLTVFEDAKGEKRTQVNGCWAEVNDPVQAFIQAESPTAKAKAKAKGKAKAEAMATPATDAKEDDAPKESAFDKAKHIAGAGIAAVGSLFHHKDDEKPKEHDAKTMPLPQPETAQSRKKKLDQTLDSVGLSEFKSVMAEHGIDTCEVMQQMTDDELTAMGFKLGHLRKFHEAFPRGLAYVIVNPMNSNMPGVGFRSGKVESGDIITYAGWGTTVTGIDQGDGWLKVGARYLPMQLNGTPVIVSAAAAPTVAVLPVPQGHESDDSDAETQASKSEAGSKKEGFFAGAMHSMAHLLHLDGEHGQHAEKAEEAAGISTSKAKGSSKAAAGTSKAAGSWKASAKASSSPVVEQRVVEIAARSDVPLMSEAIKVGDRVTVTTGGQEFDATVLELPSEGDSRYKIHCDTDPEGVVSRTNAIRLKQAGLGAYPKVSSISPVPTTVLQGAQYSLPPTTLLPPATAPLRREASRERLGFAPATVQGTTVPGARRLVGHSWSAARSPPVAVAREARSLRMGPSVIAASPAGLSGSPMTGAPMTMLPPRSAQTVPLNSVPSVVGAKVLGSSTVI